MKRKNYDHLIGKRFHFLTVLSVERRYGKRQEEVYLKCRCDCGYVGERLMRNILTGRNKGCGCRSFKIESKYSHVDDKSLMHTWRGIIDRCYNLRSRQYEDYGGRGITVCDRWKNSFENFILDVGEKPSPKHSIDRKDNNGNYEPSNCRWATRKEQMNNTRKQAILTGSMIARSVGLSRQRIHQMYLAKKLDGFIVGRFGNSVIYSPETINFLRERSQSLSW